MKSTINISTPVLHVFETCLGWMGIIGSWKGIQRVILPHRDRGILIDSIKLPYVLSADGDFLSDVSSRLQRYLNGEKIEFADKLDLEGATDFQISVWATTQTIPFGTTESYSWLAKKINCARGMRAVGQALGKNPVPIIVPCHRIIAVSGRLGGYSGGLDMKRYLLRLEGNLDIDSK